MWKELISEILKTEVTLQKLFQFVGLQKLNGSLKYGKVDESIGQERKGECA